MKVEPVAGIAASGVGRVTARGAGGRLPHRLRRLDEVWLGHGFPRYFLTTCVCECIYSWSIKAVSCGKSDALWLVGDALCGVARSFASARLGES